MRIAIFDCPKGIAGDMTVGALIDAGMPFELLSSEIKKLHLKGYQLDLKEIRSGAFRAKKFFVHLQHHHSHHHTPLKEIEKTIRGSKLSLPIKTRAIKIFQNLGRAEARVHGVPLQKIYFHEAGAMDSFIDIVGTAICFHHLKIENAYVRHISVGRGIQTGNHGKMPIPVPGAYELLKDFWIEQADYSQEMVTPTGAAILATLCEKGKKIPRVQLESIGYGAGDREFDGEPGVVRISLGKV